MTSETHSHQPGGKLYEDDLDRRVEEHFGNAIWEEVDKYLKMMKLKGEDVLDLPALKPNVEEAVLGELRIQFRTQGWQLVHHLYFSELDSLEVHPNQELVTLIFETPIIYTKCWI